MNKLIALLLTMAVVAAQAQTSGVLAAHGATTDSPSSIYQNSGTGSAPRTFQSKFADHTNAADFAGVLCNGAHDDAAGIQRALNYQASVGPGQVDLPVSAKGCGYATTIVVPQGVTLQSQGGWDSGGLVALAPNINPAIQLKGDHAAVRHMRITANAAGVNTSGTTVAMSTYAGQVADDLYINGPCIGIDVNGFQAEATDIFIQGSQGGECGGVRVGHLTKNVNTIDPRIENVTFTGSQKTPAGFGLLVEDAGGLVLTGDDFVYANVGTKFYPGMNQRIDWTTGSGTYLGDTSVAANMVVDVQPLPYAGWTPGTAYAANAYTVSAGNLYRAVTGGKSASRGGPSGKGAGITDGSVRWNYEGAALPGTVRSIECTNCWLSNPRAPGSNNLLVTNTGGGNVYGIHFVALRMYNSQANAAQINAGTDISFDATQFCGNGLGQGSNANVALGAGVSNVQIRNSKIGAGCDGMPTSPTLNYGVKFGGKNAEILLTGDDFTGVSQPIGGTVPATGLVMYGNHGLPNMITPSSTVAALPACGASQRGWVELVTDASHPIYNSPLVGGGASVVIGLCNGTAWTAH